MAYLWIVNPDSKYNSGVQTTAKTAFPFYVDYTGQVVKSEEIGKDGALEITYSRVNQQTLKEYLQLHPTYKVLNDRAVDARLDKYAEDMCFTWYEIDHDNYMEMLEVLPPLRWTSNSFFICEADTQDVHAFFCKHYDKYYTAKARLSHKPDRIWDSLKETIKEGGVKAG
jgi:hypothetical protein